MKKVTPLFTITESMQEAFDKSIAQIRKQGYMLSHRDGFPSQCMYRGTAGRMCAAGPFIPDEHVLVCEHNNISSLERMGSIAFSNRSVLYLLMELQGIHDSRAAIIFPFSAAKARDNPVYFEARWASLAEKNGLSYIAPEL